MVRVRTSTKFNMFHGNKTLFFLKTICKSKMFQIFSKSKNILTEKEYFTHTTSAEAVVRRCSVEKVFLEISQNSQENTCNLIKKETLAQVFSCEFWEISKNTFFLCNTSGGCFCIHSWSYLWEMDWGVQHLTLSPFYYRTPPVTAKTSRLIKVNEHSQSYTHISTSTKKHFLL